MTRTETITQMAGAVAQGWRLLPAALAEAYDAGYRAADLDAQRMRQAEIKARRRPGGARAGRGKS